jgi:hypothetical protein
LFKNSGGYLPIRELLPNLRAVAPDPGNRPPETPVQWLDDELLVAPLDKPTRC